METGRPYHVLNIRDKDDLQVRGLMEKIDILMGGNNNSHYGVIVNAVERERREIKDRALQKLASSFESTTGDMRFICV